MKNRKPAALMSYVHSDDKYGHLTTFRERLSDEAQVQTGMEFLIFQDIKDIYWGEDWSHRIENSLLDEVTFLIPIITPSFFNSKPCRDELKRFVGREEKLRRNDLILPIYFVDTPLLNDVELRATDELAELIASRQWADWRDLRFEPFTNPQVGKSLAQLAVQLRDALARVQRIKIAVQTSTVSKAQLPAVPTSEDGEKPIGSPTAKKQPPTYIVEPMHHGDFVTITDAFKRVQPGSRIIVRPGLYQEGLVIDKPLEIIGDGERGEILIQADSTNVILFQTSMGRVVNLTLRQVGEGSSCVEIAQGRLELEDCDITSQNSSCVNIQGGADPRLRRNRIHDSKTACGVEVHENAQGTLEDNDIFGNFLSNVEIYNGANPMLRHNRIYDSKQAGVFVYDGAQGTLEDNDIFGNVVVGVAIETTANLILRRNRIHDSKQGGVCVQNGGQGILEDNEIFDNGQSGVFVISGSNLSVKNNLIRENSHWGISIDQNSGGTFEHNQLTRNERGAWFISEDSEANVTRVNNKE
jgi:F-box protein 11